jgi:archaemetzincin
MKEAVEVWWIGQSGAEAALLQAVRRAVESTFDLRADLGSAPGPPAAAYDARRRQTSSTALLHWIAATAPRRRVLGLTDADLFIPVLTFVYGEAQLGGHAAVVSSARLQASDPHRHRERVVKEALHELGHTFGLLHCDEPHCLMARSASLPGVDAKRALCADCRLRLHAAPRRTP